MSQQSISKKFDFHEKIDKEFIFNLYEDDYTYISEVFQTSLECFDSDIARVQESFEAGDIDSLCKAIHKIKPVFGFTGLLSYQEQLGKFEKICSQLSNTDSLAQDFRELMETLSDGKRILEQELTRLHSFAA